MGRVNLFRALVAGLTANEFLLLREVVDERCCCDEVGVGTLAEAAADLPARPGVPGMRRPRRPEGRVHRRRRPEADPPPLRQEVHLPHRHRPRALPQAAPLWVSFIRLMRHNVPVECTAELCGVSHRTDFEWRRRVLATVTGYQDRIVLRETVWVDKIHINETDLSKGYGQLHKRGLSRQKLRI